MNTDIRNIIITICKTLEGLPSMIAQSLKYKLEIYPSPSVYWFEGGSPLELQVVDGGDQVIMENGDREGGVSRGQYSFIVAILMRRPSQFEGQFASILEDLSDDIQTYRREIKLALDGSFLPYTPLVGEDAIELLTRPLVYSGSSNVQTNDKYPDLMVKELRFFGGINDELH